MTDRELLELAAKASGKVHQGIYFGDKGLRVGDHGNGYASWIEWWNPLEDDGDALRLAVRLNLSIHQHQHGAGWVDVGMFKALTGGDPYAATRRAIVRAAAEIGKGVA